MLYIKKLPTLSIKTKTMLFVGVLFVAMAIIFGWMRYIDVKDSIEKSRKANSLQIQNIYKMTRKHTRDFYLNRAHANINSYGIKQALAKKDVSQLTELSLRRWEVLKQENPFLLSMRFYDMNNSLLVYLGKKPQLKQLPFIDKLPHKIHVGFFALKDYAAYHVLVPVQYKNNFIGALEFTISPKYFLHTVQELSPMQGYIRLADGSYIPPSSKLMLANLKKDSYFIHTIDSQDLSTDKYLHFFFLQDISEEQQKLKDAFYESFLIAIIIIAFLLVILNYGFNVLIYRLQESESRLKELNHTLEDRISFEIATRMKNEQMLMHQSKLAAMGEMIGNIAHQWKQPLSELGAILMNIQILWQTRKLTDIVFEDRAHRSEELIFYMSKTIDDFRNFFIDEKEKEMYNINDAIEKAISIIKPALENHHIALQFSKECDCERYGYPNQLAQAVLNIISNAKDILLERNIKNPSIKINITKIDEKNLISIEDNGGGIKVAPMEKIFEPYFTTKHAKNGTGIGLYMSKTIIEKNADGILRVSNNKDGALFEIII